MPLITKLERKFGWIAIPGVVRVLLAFQVLVFILIQVQIAGTETGDEVSPAILKLLNLDVAKILSGEVWRLFSFAFLPPVVYLDGILWLLIYLMFTRWIGDMLEAIWGAFRTTLYVLGAIVGTVLGSFVIHMATGGAGIPAPYMLSLALLAAVAVYNPDVEILLFFIIPVKIKWLAIFGGAAFGLLVFANTMLNPLQGLGVLLSMSCFLFAFGPGFRKEMALRGQSKVRRRRFEKEKLPETFSLHRCADCGKTEHDDPDLEFRVSAEGEEYCEVCRAKSS